MVAIILLVIGLALMVLSVIFTGLLRFMPYLTGLGISATFCAVFPQIRDCIPGHPWMSYLSALAVTEVTIFILMHLPHVGRAFSVILSELFIALAGGIILGRIEPDSAGFCVFVTVSYLAASAFFMITNLRSTAIERETGSDPAVRFIPVRIFIAALYICTAFILVAVPIKYLWMPYL